MNSVAHTGSFPQHMLDVIVKQASHVRQRHLDIFGTLKEMSSHCSNDLVDYFTWQNWEGFSCLKVKGYVQIAHKKDKYWTPHSCVFLRYFDSILYLDCTLDYYNLFGQAHPPIYLSPICPVSNVDIPAQFLFRHGKLKLQLCYVSNVQP